MRYIVFSTTYSKNGNILSTRSISVDECEFNKFRNLFEDGIHIIEIEVFSTLTILNIKLFKD